jgi:hypothetical protein
VILFSSLVESIIDTPHSIQNLATAGKSRLHELHFFINALPQIIQNLESIGLLDLQFKHSTILLLFVLI